MTSLLLTDEGRSRSFADNDFPLAIGLAADSSLVVGAAAEAAPALWILAHQRGLSIQPDTGYGRTYYNGASLASPAWLRHGDELAIGDWTFTVSLATEGGAYTLEARRSARAEAAKRFGARLGGNDHGRGMATPKRIALAVFGVLALGVAYVLTASPLELRITPEPDVVSVSGWLPRVPLGDRYLIFPGSYVVEAEKAGYRPLRQTIAIPYGASPTFEFEMKKLPGLVQVTTPPVEGAKVLVDGAEAGVSPATLEIDAGIHEVRVVSERYLPETRRVDVQGEGQRQALEIPLQPAWGTLAVSTVPDKALVKSGGKELGETPVSFEAVQGTHELEFVKEGWKPATRRVELRAGVTLTVPPVLLERIDGTLALSSDPAGASVLVNGQFQGQTPLSLALVGDRDHQLTLSRAGHESDRRTVRVEGGKSIRLAVRLQPELGTVFLTTNPPGATLTINGRPGGSATQRLSLQTVPQVLEITRPGYESQRIELTPQRDIPKRLDITLKTAADALKERVAKGMVTPGGQKLALIYIGTPARFTMGSPRREAGRRSNEVEYPVELSRPFLMSEKEVTNAEFQKFHPGHKSGSYQSTSLEGADQPVVNVSWEEAARYANWLSIREGLQPAYREEGGKVLPVVPLTTGYRLPTEAEWEFAARYDGGRRPAGQPLQFPWGDAMPPSKESGNYAHDGSALPFAIPGYNDGFTATAPVGKFSPNQSQIYDLGGNVAEWCHDFYDVLTANLGTVRRDPAGPAEGRFHVIKGSSWRSGSNTELRLTYRDYAEKPRDDLGFRIVRYVDAAR